MTGIDVKFSEAISSMPFLQEQPATACVWICRKHGLQAGHVAPLLQGSPLPDFLVLDDGSQLRIRLLKVHLGLREDPGQARLNPVCVPVCVGHPVPA